MIRMRRVIIQPRRPQMMTLLNVLFPPRSVTDHLREVSPDRLGRVASLLDDGVGLC